MSLRIRTLLLISVVLVGLFIVLYIISRTVLLNSFAQIEAQAATQNVERLINALNDELAQLSVTNRDYSQWDDTYQFVQDRNQEFIDANLVDSVFVNLNVNLMLYVNTTGEVVFGKAVDFQTEAETALPAGLDDLLAAGSPLLNLPADGEVAGIVQLPDSLLLIASHPILDSLAQEPPRGVLIFARFLTAAEVQKLSERLRLPVSVYPAAEPDLPTGVRSVLTQLSSDAHIEVQPLNADTIAGYVAVNDIYGNPILALRIDMPRDIYTQGQTTITFFLLLLAVTGVIFAAAALFLLERQVLRPIMRLGTSVNQIRSSGDISGRVAVTGNNELATLGRDINHMLAALEQTQIKMNESNYRLGVVIKSAPIILWAVNQEGVFTLFEGKGLDVLQIDGKQATGRHFADVFVNVPQIVEEIRRALKGETIDSIVPVREFTFDARYTPLLDENGAVNGVLGVATDITERTMAEQALTQAYEEAYEQNQKLRRTQEFMRSTVGVMAETVRRDASRQELIDYLDFVSQQMNSLS